MYRYYAVLTSEERMTTPAPFGAVLLATLPICPSIAGTGFAQQIWGGMGVIPAFSFLHPAFVMNRAFSPTGHILCVIDYWVDANVHPETQNRPVIQAVGSHPAIGDPILWTQVAPLSASPGFTIGSLLDSLNLSNGLFSYDINMQVSTVGGGGISFPVYERLTTGSGSTTVQVGNLISQVSSTLNLEQTPHFHNTVFVGPDELLEVFAVSYADVNSVIHPWLSADYLGHSQPLVSMVKSGSRDKVGVGAPVDTDVVTVSYGYDVSDDTKIAPYASGCGFTSTFLVEASTTRHALYISVGVLRHYTIRSVNWYYLP